MKYQVPKEVAEAFDYHEKTLGNIPVDERIRLYMSITSTTTSGPTKVLKEFSQKEPILYLLTLIYGYVPKIDLRTEVTKMVTEWINKPYVENEQKDIEEFAERVIEFFHQKT